MTPQEYLEQVRQLALQRVPDSWGIRNAELRYVTDLSSVPLSDRIEVSRGTTNAVTQYSPWLGIPVVMIYALAFGRKGQLQLQHSIVTLHELGHAHLANNPRNDAHGPIWADTCRRIGLITQPYDDYTSHDNALVSAHLDPEMQKAVDRLGPFPTDPAVEAKIRQLDQQIAPGRNPDPWQELMDSLKGREVNMDLWRAINGTDE